MNIAMLLTAARLLLAPLFAFTFISGYRHGPAAGWLWAAAAVTALSELSDAFDGYFARRYHTVTDFGKVFDPAVDSIARLTAFISFMVCGLIPLWMFLLFMYRDMLMALLRTVCASRGLVLAARPSGKFKAVLQGVAIALVLMLALLQAHGMAWASGQVWGRPYAFWIVLLPALYTLGSMIDYVIPNWGKIMDMSRVDRSARTA